MTDKKIIELTESLYQVTDRMDDRDAIKWRLREAALDFSNITQKSEKSSFTEEVKKSDLLKGIGSMLRICTSIFYVARVNFEVLLREYESYGQKQQNSQKKADEKNSDRAAKDELSPSPMVSHLIVRKESQNPTDRQQRIMGFLSDKKSASVSDISVFFENAVSGKTIQRDLIDLVSKGQVRADGEKRWRVYSVVS